MPDPKNHIPADYLSLSDALIDHHVRKFGYGPDFTIQGVVTPEFEQVQAEFLEALRSGRLQALYRPPDSHENFGISAQDWKAASSPERVFYHERFPDGHRLAGHTPFLDRRSFKEWSMERAEDWSKGSRRDPMERPHWTIGEAIAWIAWRTPHALTVFDEPETVLYGFFETLKRYQRETAPTPLRNVEAAFDELKDLCALGTLTATALPIAQDCNIRRISIPAIEWAGLVPDNDDGIRGRENSLRNEGESFPLYWHVKFQRAEILKCWPPIRDIEENKTKPTRKYDWRNSEDYQEVERYFIENFRRPFLEANAHRRVYEEWWPEVQNTFPGFGSRGAKKIFKDNKPPSWTSGRRADSEKPD